MTATCPSRRALTALAAMVIVMAALSACSDSDDAPGSEQFYNGTSAVAVTVAVEAYAGAEAPDPADFSVMLMSNTTGVTTDWTPLPEWNAQTRYLAGEYTLYAVWGDIYAEGYGAVSYYGAHTFTLAQGNTAEVSVTASLSKAPLSVTMTGDALPALTLHTLGGAYVAVDPARAGEPLYLNPGRTELIATAGDARFRLGLYDSEAARLRRLDIAATGTLVTAALDGETLGRLDLSPAALAAPGPQITLTGAIDAEPLQLAEYTVPPESVAFTLAAPSAPAELTLDINSPLLRSVGAPAAVSLTDPADPGRQYFAERGVELPLIATASATIDISPVLRLLHRVLGVEGASVFTLEAVDGATGRMAVSPALAVNTLQCDPEVSAVTPAMMGVDRAEVTVAGTVAVNPDQLAFATHEAAPAALTVTAREALDADGRRWRLTLEVPAGNEPLEVDMTYGGRQAATFTLLRQAPDYAVAADPFALRLKLKITAADAATRAYVTRKANVWIDGATANVLSRDADTGIITCLGLKEAAETQVAVSLLAESDQEGGLATRTLTVTTESAAPLPAGDFDTAKDAIKATLDCGGTYSQTTAPIYNCQNTVSLALKAPKGWATVNAKTFCETADRRNTWYMQPSTWSSLDTANGLGDYGVELQTVAYDPHGAPIAPYLQAGAPYTDYSLTVPAISYRAAGRLFLGSYEFDPATMTETYTEGIDFASRPLSLNGYYKYVPGEAMPADRGLARVEVLDAGGRVIATATATLQPAAEWTAFSAAIDYPEFGVRAATLRVLVTSSADIGDIAHESANLSTTPYPKTGSSTGSHLWVDNLSLAY